MTLDYEARKASALTCESYPDENFHTRFRKIVDAIPSDFRVLDVACGSGTLVAALQRKGCECVGIDLNPAAVKVARSKGLDVHQGDADAFDSDARVGEILLARYDVVVFSKCLMYLRKKNALMAALQTQHVLVHQGNPFYWKFILGLVQREGVGPYVAAQGGEIDINSPRALIRWGESYGYRGRRVHGGWLRGRDMVVQFSR